VIALRPEERQAIEERFRDVAARWDELTRYRSNLGALRSHHVYRDLIGLGESAVPLLLGELERRPSVTWLMPLADITGADPVPPELAGRVAAMADA
jgi:hypothetical protein